MGIRTIAPFKGMFKVVDKISKEMNTWVKEHDIRTAGPPFLRFHVIDMRGAMDITYGVPVDVALPQDGAVTSDVLPGGRFASLILRIINQPAGSKASEPLE